ncbi:MAG: magnesium and cobalt transport protein CorA, partial [Spirochaetales bacterium]|nr:magnesium and cobalt transport protein CorA [Spirochaetales bacterium]
DIDLIHAKTLPFLHDIYDHIIQIIESTETFREVLSNIRDVALSTISNKMNEIMKVLTIFASIFIPLTFLAGLYGMNFKYMPELGFPWAYPLLLVIMITVAGFMLSYFKRMKWIGKKKQKSQE